MLKLEWFILLALYKINSLLKKSLKKVLTHFYWGGIVILVLETGTKRQKKLLKKLLTRWSWDDKVLLASEKGSQRKKLLKKVVDKEKQLW